MFLIEMRGIFRNKKNGMYYYVKSIARSVETPNNYVVVYEQLYNSKLRGTNIPLSKGSVWTRDIIEFDNKFKCVFDIPGLNYIAKSILTIFS